MMRSEINGKGGEEEMAGVLYTVFCREGTQEGGGEGMIHGGLGAGVFLSTLTSHTEAGGKECIAKGVGPSQGGVPFEVSMR